MKTGQEILNEYCIMEHKFVKDYLSDEEYNNFMNDVFKTMGFAFHRVHVRIEEFKHGLMRVLENKLKRRTHEH